MTPHAGHETDPADGAGSQYDSDNDGSESEDAADEPTIKWSEQKMRLLQFYEEDIEKFADRLIKSFDLEEQIGKQCSSKGTVLG